MTVAVVNGSYESIGGVVLPLNVRRLLADRKVEGVDWRVIAFYTTWGYWNCWYYPHIGQLFSFYGGSLPAIANTVWVLLFLRFRGHAC